MSFDVLAKAIAAGFIGCGVLFVIPHLAGLDRLRWLSKVLARLGHLREGPFFRRRRPGPIVGASACFLMLAGPAVVAFVIALVPFKQSFDNSLWVGVQIVLPPLLVLYVAPVLLRFLLWWGAIIPVRVVWPVGLVTALTGLGMLIERM